MAYAGATVDASCGVHRLLTTRTSPLPLPRMRRLFLFGALASVGLALVTVVGSEHSLGLRGAATIAGLALCVSWIAGERRGSFPAIADALEVPALFVLLYVAPGDPFVPLFGLGFRSLYGGPAAAARRYALWVAALLVAHLSRGSTQMHADLARGVGLALVPLTFQILRSTLERLQSSERRLASLVQNSTDVVTVVGADLVVRWQADSMLAALGHRARDVRGTSLLALVHPEDRPRLRAYVHDADGHPGLTRTLHLRLRHADLGYRDFEVVISNRLHDPSVGGMVLNMRDATERRRLEQELRRLVTEREHEALHDPLTGLANRRRLFNHLGAMIVAADADQDTFALLIIDLDGFKELNDTLGHQAGDELLTELGPRLTGVAPRSGLVARLGGDEFAVVLAPSREPDAADAAEQIRAAIERPFTLRGLTVRVRASVGIAMYPEHAQDLATLVQRADIAMYCAKDEGLGHAFYDETRDGYSTERLTLIGELPEAMERDELVVFYQPKVDFATERICGAEALVRWEHPVHGLLAPDAFLALVERSGLMPALTLKVLDQSLAQCARWRAGGLELGVAVNLAASNLVDLGFPEKVEEMLGEHGVHASALTLEVTETIVGGDSPRALEVLRQLRDLGVTLSLDDFGTGTSSLSFLRRLPVQELKIDKSFVLDMVEHPQDAAIVRTIMRLAHDLDVTVVAEGIETVEAYERLRADGCDRGQGFLLGRPMPADQLTQLARRHTAAV